MTTPLVAGVALGLAARAVGAVRDVLRRHTHDLGLAYRWMLVALHACQMGLDTGALLAVPLGLAAAIAATKPLLVVMLRCGPRRDWLKIVPGAGGIGACITGFAWAVVDVPVQAMDPVIVGGIVAGTAVLVLGLQFGCVMRCQMDVGLLGSAASLGTRAIWLDWGGSPWMAAVVGVMVAWRSVGVYWSLPTPCIRLGLVTQVMAMMLSGAACGEMDAWTAERAWIGCTSVACSGIIGVWLQAWADRSRECPRHEPVADVPQMHLVLELDISPDPGGPPGYPHQFEPPPAYSATL